MAVTDLEATRAMLERLKMPIARERLGDLLEESVREKLAPHGLLDLLLKTEIDAREEKRVSVNLKFSGLPPGMTLESFDFAFQCQQRSKIPQFQRSKIPHPGSVIYHPFRFPAAPLSFSLSAGRILP